MEMTVSKKLAALVLAVVGLLALAPSAIPKTVAQLTAADKVGHATQVGFGIARGVSYAAIAFAIGALAFLIWTWLPALRGVAGADERWREASEGFSRRLHGLLVLAL